MNFKTLNDYTCIENNNEYSTENDSIQQLTSGTRDEKNPSDKKNVRKAIDRYLERKRLKHDLGGDIY